MQKKNFCLTGTLHVQGLFMPCTNNVIWRLVTGKRTQQDDPELRDLTNRIQNNFQNFDPSSPIALLQMNSLAFTKLLQKMGKPNFLDSTRKIRDMLIKEVEATVPYEGGNYIERALYEGTTEKDSVFRKIDGKPILLSQLADLFVAGELGYKVPMNKDVSKMTLFCRN